MEEWLVNKGKCLIKIILCESVPFRKLGVNLLLFLSMLLSPCLSVQQSVYSQPDIINEYY